MMRRKESHKGTGNVLTDLEFEDAEELSAKALLAVRLNELDRDPGHPWIPCNPLTGSPPWMCEVAY